ncbi:flagellar biosynthesis protein FlhF [Paenibacillus cremeus]|uniref:Flagellar biosynthesis protein FlhF n=1 Tax=Paenibacillus cremeus TaxID=2163881 RepID=A0A559KET7_9BACL|nr:flagellar biosynthesis protein FlhF [Paenibacillus cremeus]TVY10640.1 flagellar biosynthesis protein FlhF [Paenibacillus cremeus]
MRVKRYVVDSMPDALQKIRTDLGKDAVILNTKEIRSGGFLGLFAKKKIEVIAATDSSSPSGGVGSASKSATAVATKPSPMITAQPQVAKATAAAAYGSIREEKPTLAFPDVPDVLPPRPMAPQPAPITSTHTFVPQSPKERLEQTSSRKEKEELLLDEIKQMKELMLMLSKQSNAQAPADPVIVDLEQRLRNQEVDADFITELMGLVKSEAESGEVPVTQELAVEIVKKRLSELLQSNGRKPIDRDTRIAHFVGPTGVGKTTTIAKLAAEQVLKHQRKVGFITSDTYRIAAVEQLKTYATILNVPLEVVFSPLDLNKAFERLSDCDLIFMDTAGRNFRNEMYVSELNALLQSNGHSETFLVLSLTTKYKDMKAITNNFSKFKLDKVLFTKMDETDSFGPIVNLIREFGLQTSYVANGQNVPDDILELNEKQIIDLILEDNQHE